MISLDPTGDGLVAEPLCVELAPVCDLVVCRHSYSRSDACGGEVPHDRAAVVAVLLGQVVGRHASFVVSDDQPETIARDPSVGAMRLPLPHLVDRLRSTSVLQGAPTPVNLFCIAGEQPGLTRFELATPWEDPVDFRSPPIVSGTRGFPCVYREPGGSLGTSVAGWWRFLAGKLDGFLIGRARTRAKNN